MWNRISKADANNDGSVSKDELEAHIKKMREERQKDQKPATPADAKKPENKPEEKAKDAKPDDANPQASNVGGDGPVDALAPVNVGD